MSIDLGNANILLTGATGFVGQAILERLLTSHPGTTITVLVRPKGTISAERRLTSLLRKSVFANWIEQVGADEAKRIVAERVRVVEGSLGDLGPEPEKLDLVLHSASSVNFDDPIDQAFGTNVSGVAKLYQALLAAGADPHVVHVSTAYVNGARKGLVTEDPVEHEVDWRVEEQAALTARSRVDEASRQPARLRQFLKEAQQAVGKVGPQAVAEATEAARRAWVDEQLVEHGRARAQSLGWTDAYTLTKALAERLAEELWLGNGHRLSVVRPSIIESALRHPYPGWIDGFKVADPLIIAYGRGQLPEIPGPARQRAGRRPGRLRGERGAGRGGHRGAAGSRPVLPHGLGGDQPAALPPDVRRDPHLLHREPHSGGERAHPGAAVEIPRRGPVRGRDEAQGDRRQARRPHALAAAGRRTHPGMAGQPGIGRA